MNPHAPNFPHGTPSGFDAGCRSAACSGAVLSGITCRDAKRRYVGDWRFRVRMDEGMAAGDILALEAAEVHAEKVARAAAKVADREAERLARKEANRKPRKQAAPRAPRKPRMQSHGTNAGYQRGCRTDDCPNVAAGGISCVEAKRKFQRDYNEARKRGEYKPITHGTISGYQAGCRDNCTSQPSCREVANAKARDRHARKKRGEPMQVKTPAQHGTVSGYKALNCRVGCPAEKSCSEVKAEYQAAWKARSKAA